MASQMYFYPPSEGKPGWCCKLATQQCAHQKKNGTRCNKKIQIGTPLCPAHSKEVYGVVIRKSGIEGAGKGLFTTRPMTKGSMICPYAGETINKSCMSRRYPKVSTYVAGTHVPGEYIDAACVRGIGAMANAQFTNAGKVKDVKYHNAVISSHATHEKNPHRLWLTATKNIPANREIFVYYGSAYTLHEHSTKFSMEPDTRPC